MMSLCCRLLRSCLAGRPLLTVLALVAVSVIGTASCTDDVIVGSTEEGDSDTAAVDVNLDGQIRGDGGGAEASADTSPEDIAIADDATGADAPEVSAPCPLGQDCTCTVDADCASGVCLVDPSTGIGKCAVPCQDGSCGPDFVCTETTLPGGGKLALCLPKPPCKPATEVCNGSDDNCDGKTDEGFCFDGNPCSDDVCTADGICTHPDNVLPCDDGNACSKGDTCAAGQCSPGTGSGCDDDLVCTKDSCDAVAGACVNTLLTGGCEDGNACTLGDLCDSGNCVSGQPLACDDKNPCTNDSCDPKVGCLNLANAATCSDGDACTTGDACALGSCKGGAAKDCSDGSDCTLDLCKDGQCTQLPVEATCSDDNACTEADLCKNGTCIGKNKDCKDNNPCTDDTCAAGACVNKLVPDKTVCDDSNACTLGDICDHDGLCVGLDKNCDDSNPCTLDKCQVTDGQCQHEPTQGQPCDDGNACTLGDACLNGNCASGGPKVCSDGNPCTNDSCDPGNGTCAFVANADPCTDNNPCTLIDTCAGSQCISGKAKDCADGNNCTLDTCDTATGACANPNTVAGISCEDGALCTQGDACKDGACTPGKAISCDDGNPCTKDACNPATGKCASVDDDGKLCSDGNPCTDSDACQTGKCLSGKIICQCQSTADCATKEDGDACNGLLFCDIASHTCQVDLKTVVVCDSTKNTACLAWTCNSKTAKCEPANAGNGKQCDADNSICTKDDACLAGMCAPGPMIGCDDSNPCTNDSCSPTTGCAHVNNQKSCTDNNPCTEIDICANGSCFGGGPKACDDGNACTADSCNPANGLCQGKLLTGDGCDDGNLCTLTDVCASGVCKPKSNTNCDDGKPCTSDSCDPKSGKCLYGNAPNGLQCEDGSQCTVGDFCNFGGCSPGKVTVCVDGSPCTLDGCDVATGKCVFKASNESGACSDGDSCTLGDKCIGGLCFSGVPKFCTDANPCTLSKCDPVNGSCVAKPGNLPCDDGNACSEGDGCADGICKPKTFILCDDGQLCTDDSCNTATGKCVFAPTTKPCNDGSKCTANDLCTSGSCVGTPVGCNDGNPCTTESCDPTLGCVYVAANNGQACSDGNACTSGDVCSNGGCKGVGITCNDGNPCTSDACNPASGCKFTATTGGCNDGNPCTVGDSCQTGKCVSGAQALCTDSNPCTDDVCNAGNGQCTFTNDNTNTCSDGNACTTGDTCAASQCVGGAGVKDCADNNPCTTEWCEPASGCKVVSNPAVPCDDGNPCTLKDICVNSKCLSGTIDLCNDGNPCTSDNCDAVKGCLHGNTTTPCDDGDACVGPDSCTNGVCKGANPLVCKDNTTCTDDKCDNKAGCVFTAIAGGGSTTDVFVSDTNTLGSATTVGGSGQFPDFTDFKPAVAALIGIKWTAKIAGATWIWVSYKVGDPTKNQDTEYRKEFNVVNSTEVSATLIVAADNSLVCWVNSKLVVSSLTFNNFTQEKTVDVKSALIVGKNLLRCQVTNSGIADSTPENNPAGLAFRLEVTTLVGGAPCDDGNPCTTTDVCFGGACTGVVGLTCDDGNGCTVDKCQIDKGCTNSPQNNLACEDGNPCTSGDKCLFGKCSAGSGLSCDDGIACTIDLCDTVVGCSHKAASNGVFTPIAVPSDNKVVVVPSSGSPTPAVATWNLHPDWTQAISGATWMWSADKVQAPETTTTVTLARSFDIPAGFETVVGIVTMATDGAFVCKLNGKLVGVETAETNYKTAIKISLNGKLVAGTNVWSCTLTNPGKVGATYQTNPAGLLFRIDLQWFAKGGAVPCEDGNACTAGDWCKGFFCQPGAVVSCDDDDACTNDFCDNKTGCGHSNSGATVCNDGNPCSVNDACSGGKCAGGKPADCNDNSPCTKDSCDVKAGCVNAIDDTATCDDNNPCTGNDACKAGKCIAGAAAGCDDGNPCTSDSCSTQQGCFHGLNNGAACNDDNICTANDLCDGGQCLGSAQNSCTDNNACTNDSCDPVSGCFSDPVVSGPCDDGNPCTLNDGCKSNVCVSGASKPCNDGNSCTADSCDPKSGACVFVPVADQNQCEDGNPCTVSDICGKGKCAAGPLRECGDGNPCTDDACDPGTGNCVNTILVGTYLCNDGDPCTLSDACKGGVCGGSAKVCDDKDKCTADSCNSGTGQCFYKAVVPCGP